MSSPLGIPDKTDIYSILRYAILFPLADRLVELLQALDPSAFGNWMVALAVKAAIAAAIGFIQRFVRNTTVA